MIGKKQMFLGALLLLIAFGIIRYGLFSWHGMKQFPVFMLIIGLAGLLLSWVAHRPLGAVMAGFGYPAAFLIGWVFQQDRPGPGGTSLNNLWFLWLGSYLISLLIGFVGGRRTKKI